MTEDVVYCNSCGTGINPAAKFCKSCGTAQDGESTPTEPASEASTQTDRFVSGIDPRSNPAASPEAADPDTPRSPGGPSLPKVKVGPEADEFTEVLKGYASLPGVRLAGLAALIGAGIVVAFSFLVSVFLPDDSFASVSDIDIGLFREILLNATRTTLSGLKLAGDGGELVVHTAPLIFVLVPVAGVAFGVYSRMKTSNDWSPRATLLWGAAAGIPFALLMAVLVLLSSGDTEDGLDLSATFGETFLLSLIWGALGGAIGAAAALRERDVDLPPLMPAGVGPYPGIALRILKPFGLGLVVASILGTGVWTVQSVRDAADARGERNAIVSVVDSVLYTGDLGVRYMGLGSGATFELNELAVDANTPIPVSQEGTKLSELTQGGEFNLFDYEKVMKIWAFLPLALILLGGLSLLALYAGFSTVRNLRVASQGLAAAWGAAVGPVWAVSLVILNALSEDAGFGLLQGESAFVIVLIGGALLGAGGGLLAFSQTKPQHEQSI